ncbi:MAG: hypothetical protein ACPGO3_09530 [Magnetospiraceae bacterium]
MKRYVLSVLTLLLLVAAPARADLMAESLTKARENAAKGEMGSAVAALRDAQMLLYNKAPLFMDQGILVSKKASLFGDIHPRDINTYAANEEILIYVEPMGYAIEYAGGIYRFAVAADFEVYSEDGKFRGGQESFGTWDLRSHKPVFDFYLNLTYTLDFPPGTYTVRTILRDLTNGDKVSFDIPVVLQ